jgi:hypothetical protein
MLTTGGQSVSGSVTSDTLSFPTASTVTSTNAMGTSDQPVLSESAAASYAISGTVRQGGRAWTDTLNQSLQFGNDQSNIGSSCISGCFQWVHQETTSSAAETITGPGVHVDRTDKSSYTIDSPEAQLENTSGSDFFLPASVTQQLTDVASDGSDQTSLSESIVGYGALEEDNSVPSITNGETTGTVTQDDNGDTFIRTVTTRGGVIVQDVTG